MKKYKLKKEARNFFVDKFHTVNETLEWWNKNLINIELLDEVPMVYVERGRWTGESSRSLSQFSKDGAIFEFTVHAPDLKMKDYEEMKTAELMDEIQRVLNKYFLEHYE
jgi:hypothetical protein